MLQLALIGAGRWGKNIERTLHDIGGVDLAVSTSDTETKKLLDANLKGVLVATPGSTHAQVALPFIEHGLATFIEKPFTTSLQDAQALAQATEKSGASVMVGHIHLYNPAYQKAKSLIQGAGKVRSLMFEGMNNGPYRDDMSALWDWTPHDVSMAIDVMGALPETVQAWGEKALRPNTDLYDTVTVRLQFAGGVKAIIHNSWLAPEKRKKMMVVCEDDSIVYDDVKPEHKVALYQEMGPRAQNDLVAWQEARVSYTSYDTMSPLEAEMRAFLEIVETGKRPLTDVANGVDVIRVLDAAERSIGLDGNIIQL